MKRAAIVVALVVCARAAFGGNCTFTTAPTTLDFGTYLPITGAQLQQLMTFTIDCVPPETVTVSFDPGVNSSGSYNPRDMTFGGYLMNYNIYRNAGLSEIWGNGSGGTFTQTKTMTVGDRTLTVNVYGLVPAGQNVGASTPSFYTDTVTTTMVWSGGAKSDTRTFQVRAKVDPECTVSTVPLNFGNYDPVTANAAAPLNGTGTVNVYCTPGTFVNVWLDRGLHSSGTQRNLLGPAATLLPYEIYRDPARTLVWGATNPTSDSGTSTSILIPINNGFIAYGQIPAGQDVPVGSYSDQALVTVNY